MIILGEKSIRGGICYATFIYAIAKNKCMNDYDKNKESSNLNYCDAKTYTDGQCQKVACR